MDANLDLLTTSVHVYEIKSYKKRWIILLIYIMYTALNLAQWIEYSIITNIVMKYYNVSAVAVDWTATIYLIAIIPCTIPSAYIIDKYGLRAAGLVGGLGTAFGTFIKTFSIDQDSFWLVLVGQFVLGCAQVLTFCLPLKLAAVWFKPNEISTACALGLFGTQLGIALGFVITPMVVKNHDNFDDIGAGIKLLQWGYAITLIPVAMALIFYFPKHPVKPPSYTQAQERQNRGTMTIWILLGFMKDFLQNSAFVIHSIAFSLNLGTFCIISTFINQYVLYYFPNAEEDAGRMGLTMIVSGIVGCVIVGYFLDKTHRYKETLVFLYIMAGLCMVALMFALKLESKTFTYISIGAVGFFLTAYMPAAFDMGIELTFPSFEGIAALLLVAPQQVVAVLFTMLLGKLNLLMEPFWAVGSLSLVLAIGTMITAVVPNNLKRQAAFKGNVTVKQ